MTLQQNCVALNKPSIHIGLNIILKKGVTIITFECLLSFMRTDSMWPLRCRFWEKLVLHLNDFSFFRELSKEMTLQFILYVKISNILNCSTGCLSAKCQI